MSTENSLHPINTQTEIGADVNFNTIPESMRVLRQWCVWGKRTKKGVDVCNVNKKGESKLDKTPFNPVTGQMAESNNPETWESFENVLNAYETGLYNGIGFVFNYETDGLAGIDLDHCFEDGRINDEAKSIVEKFPGAFIEISPSGDGVHVYVKGMPIHCGKGRRNKWIECYGRATNGEKSNRYFCVTGQLLGDNTINGCEIADGQTGLFWVHETYKKVVEKKPQQVNVPRDKASVQNMQDRDDESEKVEDALRYVNPDDSYETWLRIGMALKDGGYTVDVWDSWSAQGSKYKSGVCQKKWDSFKSGGVGIGTLFEYAKDSGFGFNNYARLNVNEAQKQPESPDDDGGVRGGDGGRLTEICLNGTRLIEQHNKAILVLQAKNTLPHIFVFNGALARIEQFHSEKTGETKMVINPLTVSSLRYELELITYCYTYNREKDIRSPCPPSKTLCENILAEPSYDQYRGFPEIVRVVTSPVVTKDGHVITEPGYDNKSGIYYHASTSLELSNIQPTEANVRWAKDLFFNHLLVNFPFTCDSDKANAIAYLLVPFCREMIDGPVPLHLFSAPVQASGKSLLGGLLTRIFNPLQGFSAAPKSLDADDEWRKVITSALLGQSSHLFLDNVTGKLESANLANVLTSTIWQDRLLGGNQNVQVDNKLIYAMTGNNLTLGDDMVRRTVEIRIDPQCARPEERKDFKHSNIRGWAHKHRASLVSAAVVLIRYWLAKGKPQPSPETPFMGSFEHWRHVVGGILDAAGITDFLQNKEKTVQRVDGARVLWEAFFDEWNVRFKSTPMKASELHPLAKEIGLFEEVLPAKNESGEVRRLGKQLSNYTDRVFGDVKLVKKQVHKSFSYQLVELVEVGSELRLDKNPPNPHLPHTDNSLNNEDKGGYGGKGGLQSTHRGEPNAVIYDSNVTVGGSPIRGSREFDPQNSPNPPSPLNSGDSEGGGKLSEPPLVVGTPTKSSQQAQQIWRDQTRSPYERIKDFYLNFQQGNPEKWDELCADGYAFLDLMEEMNEKCS